MSKFHPFVFVKSKVASENILIKSWVSGVMEMVGDGVCCGLERMGMMRIMEMRRKAPFCGGGPEKERGDVCVVFRTQRKLRE